MPSKLRKKTLVYVLEWDAVIHRGEYICSEFLSFVSRFGYYRCRPRCLFQVLVFLFKRLQKTRMRSKKTSPTTSESDYIVMQRSMLRYKQFLCVALEIFYPNCGSSVNFWWSLEVWFKEKISMNPRVHFRFATDLAQQKAIGERKRDMHLT